MLDTTNKFYLINPGIHQRVEKVMKRKLENGRYSFSPGSVRFMVEQETVFLINAQLLGFKNAFESGRR